MSLRRVNVDPSKQGVRPLSLICGVCLSAAQVTEPLSHAAPGRPVIDGECMRRLCHNPMVSLSQPSKRPYVLAVFLIIAGLIGLWAAFELTLDKFALLQNPHAQLNCNINPLVGCGKNLDSWQGSVLGFPNPLIGLMCWVAPVAVGVGILAGARFARWFWMLFNLGIVGALVLVIFLITESLYSLFVLCPYCMITWTVTIPTFWAVTLYNLKTGNIPVPASIRQRAAAVYSWVPLITLVSYAVVAIFAQIQTNWIPNAFL